MQRHFNFLLSSRGIIETAPTLRFEVKKNYLSSSNLVIVKEEMDTFYAEFVSSPARRLGDYIEFQPFSLRG